MISNTLSVRIKIIIMYRIVRICFCRIVVR